MRLLELNYKEIKPNGRIWIDIDKIDYIKDTIEEDESLMSVNNNPMFINLSVKDLLEKIQDKLTNG